MFTPDIFSFLGDLSANNYKEWFHENKPRYQSCRDNFNQNIELIIHEISSFDKSVAGLEPKNCVFRINRDIRFSKDKSPYKTNFGAFIAPGGRNKGNAGYYLHLDPAGSFLAGGIYMPPSPVLKSIRQEIFENLEEFEEIVTHPEFIKHFKAIDAEKLKTKPKGFPDDFRGLEYLKFKHYTVIKQYNSEDFCKIDFLKEIKEVYKSLYPLNRFLNFAVQKG
ncbi:MAG TPA: TIGR02453 family protein [Bacteroidales bacterium]|jgi:uncharacterized protein (TIGR02453 family)|nr:TIGR02453 family protein [Bacteroidales bacterium]